MYFHQRPLRIVSRSWNTLHFHLKLKYIAVTWSSLHILPWESVMWTYPQENQPFNSFTRILYGSENIRTDIQYDGEKFLCKFTSARNIKDQVNISVESSCYLFYLEQQRPLSSGTRNHDRARWETRNLGIILKLDGVMYVVYKWRSEEICPSPISYSLCFPMNPFYIQYLFPIMFYPFKYVTISGYVTYPFKCCWYHIHSNVPSTWNYFSQYHYPGISSPELRPCNLCVCNLALCNMFVTGFISLINGKDVSLNFKTHSSIQILLIKVALRIFYLQRVQF